MTLFSALFTAISIAAAIASLHASQPYLAALWAFGGGWFGHRALHGVLGWLYDWRAARKGRR